MLLVLVLLQGGCWDLLSGEAWSEGLGLLIVTLQGRCRAVL